MIKIKNWFQKHLPTINKWMYLLIISLILSYISFTFLERFLYICGGVSVIILQIILKEFNSSQFFQENKNGN